MAQDINIGLFMQHMIERNSGMISKKRERKMKIEQDPVQSMRTSKKMITVQLALHLGIIWYSELLDEYTFYNALRNINYIAV